MYNAYEQEPNGIASGKNTIIVNTEEDTSPGTKSENRLLAACFEGANYTLHCNRNFYDYNV